MASRNSDGGGDAEERREDDEQEDEEEEEEDGGPGPDMDVLRRETSKQYPLVELVKSREQNADYVVKQILIAPPEKNKQLMPHVPSMPFVEVMYEGRLYRGRNVDSQGALDGGGRANEGSLLDFTGKKFDSSFTTGIPFVAEIGAGKIIKAWEIVLPTMRVGERCRVACSSNYGYGAAGSPPDIPPHSALVFDMTLVGVRSSRSAASEHHSVGHDSASNDAVDSVTARLEELRAGRANELDRRKALAAKKEEAKKAAAERLAAKGCKKGGKKGGKKR